jgi:leader peptidase (prepilin peptidase)/N-methyltransferase
MTPPVRRGPATLALLSLAPGLLPLAGPERGVWVAAWAAFGLVVGSFLNVVIHRHPLEGESVAHPRRSRCPSCKHELGWKENLRLVSWMALRGRCRWCGWRIPWRYPLVEALTAGLWAGNAWFSSPAHWPVVLVQNVVLAGLIVATFVDFDCFEIPDEVSIGGMVLAPLSSLAVPELHARTWLAVELSGGGQVDRTGAVLASLAGMAVGGGALLAIGWLGRKVYGREAMGLGDVKLLAAGGGFVGPGGALVALLLGAMVASIVGLSNMLRFLCLTRARTRRRGRRQSLARAVGIARVAGRYVPFGPYLGIGIGIALLGWNHVLELWVELVA